MIDAVYSGQIK